MSTVAAPPQVPARSTSRLAKRSSLDQGRTPSVGPPPNPTPPERTRRKLQKNPRRSASCAPPPTKNSAASASAVSQATMSLGSKDRPRLSPSPRAAPDLSDAKWVEYLRRSGVMDDAHLASPSSMNKDDNDIPTLVPELAHLATQSASSRPSLDSSTASSPASSTSTASTMRRRAKTPVHTIGQLEGEAFTRDLFKGGKLTSGPDLVAAQYQALLDPHDPESESIYTNPHSEPPMSRAPSLDVTAYLKPQLSAGDLQFRKPASPASATAAAVPEHAAAAIIANSPAASDGTLVEFDEEAIYFKPLSFSPEPPSPLRVLNSIQDLPHQRPESTVGGHGNVGLQICTELLTRELAMAMFDKGGASSDSSALQVLVMIEAYERLRDVALEMKAQHGDLVGVETMFDTWLGALYTLYDALSGESAHAVPSEHDCAGLPTESLD